MNITVREAAEVTGWSPNYIRSACRRGVLGDAYSGGSGARMTCVVSMKKLSDFTGMSLEEIKDAVREVRWQNLKGLHGSGK